MTKKSVRPPETARLSDTDEAQEAERDAAVVRRLQEIATNGSRKADRLRAARALSDFFPLKKRARAGVE